MSDKVPELSSAEFESFSKKGTVLVDFYADWCMPCLMMAPVLDELSETFDNKINFCKINVEESPNLAQKFRVSSIPNFVLLKNGKMVEQFVGAMSSEDFEDKLRRHL